jgi:uncharacterized protein YneF (UPF0154 family)
MSVRFRACLTRAQKVVSAPTGADKSILRLGQSGSTPDRRWLEARDIWPSWFFGTSSDDKDRLRKAAICVAFNGGIPCHWQVLRSYNLHGYTRVLCARLGIFTRKYTPRGAKVKKAPAKEVIIPFRTPKYVPPPKREERPAPKPATTRSVPVVGHLMGGHVGDYYLNKKSLHEKLRETPDLGSYWAKHMIVIAGRENSAKLQAEFPGVFSEHELEEADLHYAAAHPYGDDPEYNPLDDDDFM